MDSAGKMNGRTAAAKGKSRKYSAFVELASVLRAFFAPRIVIRRFTLLLAAIVSFASLGRSASALPTMHASTIDTDVSTGELVFTGNARLEWEDALILADQVRYNPKTSVATAQGHVSMTRGPRRILADRLVYHIDQQSFVLDNVRLGEDPLFMTGTRALGNREKIIIENAMLSYSEPSPLSPAVRAKKLIYVPGGTVSAESARIGLGTTVPVSLPKFEHSVKEPLISYSEIHLDYRSSLGAQVGVGVEVPFGPNLMLGGDTSFYSRRGLLIGPAGSYNFEKDGQEIVGGFRSGYIHDYGERLEDVLGRPIQANRGFWEWDHHQEINPHLTVFGQLRYWSDSDVVRDFNPEEFFAVQTPDNFFEAVYTGNNYVVSAFTRFQPNNYILTQQRLPEIRFDLLPTTIGWGVYERFNSSAAVLRQNEIAGRPALDSTRLDAFYELTRPFSPQPWLTFTPVAGGRLTYYANTLGDHGTYTRALGEVGFDANILTSAVYEYKNEEWKIDGLRHLLIPRISYRYVPGATKGQAYIPDIDSTVFSTYLQPLDIGDQRNIDALRRTNTLRIGLDNTLQTRNTQYGSRDLLTFNIAADVDFQRDAGMQKVSALENEMTFTPADWLRFDLYESVDPKSFVVNELNTGVRLVDSNAWSVRFSNHYLAHQIKEYAIDGRYRLTEAYEVFTRLHYDVVESRFIERTIGLRQNVRNLWSIDYAVSFFSGRRRESDFGFALRVNLIGL